MNKLRPAVHHAHPAWAGLTAALWAVLLSFATAADCGPLAVGSQTDLVRVNGREATSAYTASDRTLRTTSPEGRTGEVEFDTFVRVIETREPGVLPVEVSYDPQGRLEEIRQGTGRNERKATVTSNAEGFVDTVTDPLLRTTSFEYDRVGRVTQTILPDLREVHFEYDLTRNAFAELEQLEAGYFGPPHVTGGQPPHVGAALLDVTYDRDKTGRITQKTERTRAGLIDVAAEWIATGLGAGLGARAPGLPRAPAPSSMRTTPRVSLSRSDLTRSATAAGDDGVFAITSAIQKHTDRGVSSFQGVRGDLATRNAVGRNLADGILSNPETTFTYRTTGRFGEVLDVVAPDGRGLRFQGDGQFIGLLEPPP